MQRDQIQHTENAFAASSRISHDGCVRDLNALARASLEWLGKPPDAIVRMFGAFVGAQLHATVVDARFPEAATRRTDDARSIDATAPRGQWRRIARVDIGEHGEFGEVLFGANRPEFPDALDMAMLRAAATQAAAAVRHSRMLAEYENAKNSLASQTPRLAVVAQLGTRFLASETIEEVLASAVERLQEALRADFCEVFEAGDDQSSLVLRTAVGWPGEHVGRHRLSGSEDCEAGLALRSMDPVIVRDQRTERRFRVPAVPQEMMARCGVTVRIPGLQRPFGVLGVHTRSMREFSREDVYLQQSVATLLGSALERRRAVAEREALLVRSTAAREAAEAASEAKTKFLGLMSHELRTPLNAIGGYVELLEAGTRGPISDEQRIDLTRIARNQRYLISLIDNALGYLKLENGKIRYEITDVSLATLIGALDDVIRPLIDAKALSYVRRLPPADLHVPADSGKLQQIIINLLSNAVKFTDAGGTVTLECSASDETVRIHVRDSGVGVPPDRLHGLFEPFAQLRDIDGRHGSGTGLGLSISREFALGMGGNLLASSELGRGSVFTLVLPRCAPVPNTAAAT